MLTSQRARIQWETLQASVDTGTPESLLASLHKQLPVLDRSVTDLPSTVKDMLKHSGVTESPALTEKRALIDYAQMCLESLLPRLSGEMRELFHNGRILVAEINSEFPAAQMWHCNDGRCAVVITKGLHQVYYRLIRALCTRLSPSDREDVSLPFDTTCQVVSDISFWYKHSLESAGPSYAITPNQLIMASRITTEAMTFCLAHEVCHAAFRLHPKLAHLAQNGRDEEFNADIFALSALLSEPEGNADREVPQISYCAAELFLRVQIIFERLGLEFCFEEHPAFQERLEYLRAMLSQMCESSQDANNIASAADCFTTLCAKVVEHIGDAKEEERALERAALTQLAKLDALLDQCTGGFVPDYVSFYRLASELLEEPGSAMFLEVLIRCARDFVSVFVSKTKTSNDADRWRSFQKYKLFLGFTQQLNEPFRSVLTAALQDAVSEGAS